MAYIGSIIYLTASSDYQPIDSVPLTFAAGSEAGDTLTVSVEIVDDSVVEGSEQFSLSITDSSSSAQPVTGRDLLSVAIIDNDFGEPFFPIPDL